MSSILMGIVWNRRTDFPSIVTIASTVKLSDSPVKSISISEKL